MKDKVAGALYGQALGDAFGMPGELWGIKRIRDYFGGPITEMLDGPSCNDVAFNYKNGQFTDDTGQAFVLLDSIESTRYIPDAQDIAVRMLKWADKENAFENNILGPTSKQALAKFRDKIDASCITDKALSNGSAMRIGPLGAMFSPDEKEKIVDFVYGVSKATHTSDVTIAAASMIAVAVSSAVVNSDFDDIIKDVLDIEQLGYNKGAETASPRLSERIRIGLSIADENEGNDARFLERIYNVIGAGVPVIESAPAAISIAYYAKDPNKSAFLCANLGGDTDTIGAMATSICGAYRGKSAFNPEYITLLEDQNDVDFGRYVDILMRGREVLK